MQHQISFAYLPCQTCNAKIHCDQCAETAAQSLLKLVGVTLAEVDMKNKVARVDCTMDLDDLEAAMEDIGMLPD